MASREEIESLLKIQRDAYNDNISHLMSVFNSQVNSLKSELDHAKSELVLVKHDLENKQSKLENLESKVFYLENNSNLEPVQNRLDYLEDQSRRNNLRFDGIPERTGENWEQSTAEIQKVVSKLGITREVTIDRAHRVGTRTPGSRPRPIVARFHYFSDRETILKNSNKLKNTNIYVNEDLCVNSQNLRKAQLPELKQARRDGKIAYFSHTKLITKNRSPLPPAPLEESNHSLPPQPSRPITTTSTDSSSSITITSASTDSSSTTITTTSSSTQPEPKPTLQTTAPPPLQNHPSSSQANKSTKNPVPNQANKSAKSPVPNRKSNRTK